MLDLAAAKADDRSPWRIVRGVIQSIELGWVGVMVSKVDWNR